MGDLCTVKIKGKADYERGCGELWLNHSLLFHFWRRLCRIFRKPYHWLPEQLRRHHFYGDRDRFQGQGFGGCKSHHYCCCSPGLSQTYSYMLSQTLFEKWVWKNQKYIFNRLTVLLCVFRLVVKAANGVYLALTTSLNTHTLWQRLTN